ncbi:hypothetical protein AK830_g786 [Neonectria ditissima]|uniref:Uncharacterized protein n=1 Tax=Neonectria ditissima TaxID=78410 RepID=A0A0P7BXQ4_9HYPO|nr:hypothetical protein AK830_g786 [Neonectria ditissima]
MAAQPTFSTGAGERSHDYDPRSDAMLSSPASTPLSTSPDPMPFQSLADQSSTPLSMIDDSWVADASSASSKPNAGIATATATAGAGAGGNVPAGDTHQLPAGLGRASTAALGDPGPRDAASAASVSESAAAGNSKPTLAEAGSVPVPPSADTYGYARGSQTQNQLQNQPLNQNQNQNQPQIHDAASTQQPPVLISPTALSSSSPRNSPSTVGAPVVRGQQYEGAPAPAPAIDHSSGRTATRNNTASASACASTPPTSSTSASPGHSVLAALDQIPEDRASSHDDSASLSTSPVRIASVQPHTRRAQPRARPIVRTACDSDSLAIQHPTPDINPRFGAYVGNIAQLEATAERLSMTSSIDDAIRDLHGELKRSDSRRSSLLAANLKANSIDDYASNSGSVVEHLRRNHSISSSIVSTNIAARHGGYSPGGYVLSPSHSLTGRLRSGSKNSSGRPEIDVESVLSRHGPGKASVRSVRSTKMSLAEISESEPIALTQDVLDKADSSPPLKGNNDDSHLPAELRDANMPTTDVFHNMMGDDDFLQKEKVEMARHLSRELGSQRDAQRPGTSRSDTTFQQAQDAFGDFDGVHWVPEAEGDPYSPPQPEFVAPIPRPVPQSMARPQSYMDPESGQQMLYYPARVPAMLNLPPKLSNKPKAADRENRRSQVLGMMEGSRQSGAFDLDGNRQSRFLDSNKNNRRSRHLESTVKDSQRDSWLPDPLAGHRESFADVLTAEELNAVGAEVRSVRSSHDDDHVAQAEIEPDAEGLRRPQRLSKMDPDSKRKSKMSAQLRASAYFDIPATSAPEIEVKDGSAMATLDSILDASAHAPVSAFTDHNYAGKLGNEIYGKERKRASVAASTVLRPASGEQQTKKRASFMWLGKRHSHASDDKDRRISDDGSALGPINADTRASEHEALAGGSDDSRSVRSGEDQEEGVEDDEDISDDDDDGYNGPPTTLLAELQLRKQQQKVRTQRQFPGGMHATLLEMDAVAETQRKRRNDRRVNLAWEDNDGHADEDNSDDEDVPLAILAARNQGAQNVMDLNRPIGLMERREIEDNEPLSHRRARLHGQDPRALMPRPSLMNMQANGSGLRLPPSPHSAQGVSPEPEEEEIEETLADRKKRLAAKDEAENPLPRARPVSTVFTTELLSQFGDLDEDKLKEKAASKPPGDETLGQRRRRLQAEREAREREMSFNQLSGPGPEEEAEVPVMKLRMNMANVLGAHPRREGDYRAQEERQRIEMENYAARERDAKMTAMRNQMPTALDYPSVSRSGGYRGGVFNDSTGGFGPQAAMPSPARNPQMYGGAPALQHRASAVFNPYAAPPVQQPVYGGSMVNLGAVNNNMNAYNGVNNMNPYGGALPVYGGGMQMPVNGAVPAPNRIEQWRQGVLP